MSSKKLPSILLLATISLLLLSPSSVKAWQATFHNVITKATWTHSVEATIVATP